MFPPRLGDSGEVGKPVVDVVELDAPRACSGRVRHVIRARLTADGCIQDETFVDLRIDVDVVRVGHGDPLGLNHVVLPLLVASVEDHAVALGCKCHEEDSVEEGFELVAPTADSGPPIRSFLRVNRWLVEVNDTVGVAVRCRSLPDFLVQQDSGPTGNTGSEVGIDVMSSPRLLLQVLVSALKEVPVNLAEDQAVALDARRLDGL
jgi:hypothetical protein